VTLAEYNRRFGATVLLTATTWRTWRPLQRVVVIHHGRLLFDGDLAALVRQFTAHRRSWCSSRSPAATWRGTGSGSMDAGRYTLRVPKAETARITERLLADLPSLTCWSKIHL